MHIQSIIDQFRCEDSKDLDDSIVWKKVRLTLKYQISQTEFYSGIFRTDLEIVLNMLNNMQLKWNMEYL